DEIAAYFRYASTRELKIEIGMEQEIEEKLLTALKTLTFEKLSIKLYDGYSGRFLSDLVRNRNHIEEVKIGWRNGIEHVMKAQQMLID
ncbi:hypothetical protein PENTCL1PPCAC_5183, partial [Pristionchus entomophagus]